MKRLVEFEPQAHTLYEKQGSRYVPAADHTTTDYWREGNYLVTVRPGSPSIRRMVWPRDNAEVEAAMVKVEDAMTKAMLAKRREPTQKFTPAAIKAWEKFCKIAKCDTVWTPSIYEVVQAGLEVVRKELK